DGLADCDDPDCEGIWLCPSCGDGQLRHGEECDGDVLPTTCATLGYELGATTCTKSCTVETSACRHPVCGDGAVEADEECDSGLPDGDLACTDGCLRRGDGCSAPFDLNAVWDASDRTAVWSGETTPAWRSDFDQVCKPI